MTAGVAAVPRASPTPAPPHRVPCAAGTPPALAGTRVRGIDPAGEPRVGARALVGRGPHWGISDRSAGLATERSEDYDPEVGRWIFKDPIRFSGGDPNLYVYVGNDPVNFNDPSGLTVKVDGAVGQAAYKKMLATLPEAGKSFFSRLEKDPHINVHVRPGADAAGKSRGAFSHPRDKTPCPGHQSTSAKTDWDVYYDESRMKAAERETGVPQSMDANLFHEIVGHVWREGGQGFDDMGSDNPAIEWENVYREGAGMPPTPYE